VDRTIEANANQCALCILGFLHIRLLVSPGQVVLGVNEKTLASRSKPALEL
jgi:hypothetical protein